MDCANCENCQEPCENPCADSCQDVCVDVCEEECLCTCPKTTKPTWVPSNIPFSGASEYTSEYVTWPGGKAQSMRPAYKTIDTSVPQCMETNYRTDFVPKPLQPRVPPCKSKYQPPDAKMDSETMYRHDFIGPRGGPGKSFKPMQCFRPPIVPMEGRTLYRHSYRTYDNNEMRICKPEAIKGTRGPKMPDVPMSGNTTFTDDFRPWPCAPRAEPILHPANLCPNPNAPFLESSTYTQDYVPKRMPKMPTCKKPDEFVPPVVPFQGLSTMVDDFRPPVNAPGAQSFKPCMMYTKPETKMDAISTYVDDYITWPTGCREVPPWSQKKCYEKPRFALDDTSMYRQSYKKPTGIERREAIRPPCVQWGKSGPFPDKTIYRDNYTNWPGARPSDSYKVTRCYKAPCIPMERESIMKKDFRGECGAQAQPCNAATGEAARCLRPAGDTCYKTIYACSFKNPKCLMPCIKACKRRVTCCPCHDEKKCRKHNCPELAKVCIKK